MTSPSVDLTGDVRYPDFTAQHILKCTIHALSAEFNF
jgi:hypothetical protein